MNTTPGLSAHSHPYTGFRHPWTVRFYSLVERLIPTGSRNIFFHLTFGFESVQFAYLSECQRSANKESAVTRAGGVGGVVGGGSSAVRYHRWSRQCLATKGSSRDAPLLICSDARDCEMWTSMDLLLRGATACDRVLLLERKSFGCRLQRHV